MTSMMMMTEKKSPCTLQDKAAISETTDVLHNRTGTHSQGYGCGIQGTGVQRGERWVLLKIPRCDIDGVGEGK